MCYYFDPLCLGFVLQQQSSGDPKAVPDPLGRWTRGEKTQQLELSLKVVFFLMKIAITFLVILKDLVMNFNELNNICFRNENSSYNIGLKIVQPRGWWTPAHRLPGDASWQSENLGRNHRG